jgi:hypothetical protein
MLCQCGCGQPAPIQKKNNTARRLKKGEPSRFIAGHYRKAQIKSYRVTLAAGTLQGLHRFRAEKALGKPLPSGTIVHHADGTKADDAPLVICPDNAYHFALHARMRVKAAGGNPWTEKVCPQCKQVLLRSDFTRNAATWDGLCAYCQYCYPEYQRRFRERRQAQA